MGVYKDSIRFCVKYTVVGWLIGWLGDKRPLSAQNRLYRGQGRGWRFSSARLRMANDAVTPRPRCIFVQ